jgi:gas vesicle protein
MASHHEIMDFIENIRGEMPARLHSIYEEAVDKALEQQNKRGKDFARKIIETNPMIRREFDHQKEEEGILAIFVLIIGFLGGAALMYLFDPDRGEQRRASILGQVNHAADQVRDDASHTVEQVRDEANRVVGNISETVKSTADQASDAVNKVVGNASDAADQVQDDAKKAVNKAADNLKDTTTQVKDQASKAVSSASGAAKDTAGQVGAAVSDATLMARVRTEVAKDVRAPGSIEVTVTQGVVTLKGQVQASEVKGLVEQVQALSGVKSVDNLLEVHDATPSVGSAPGNNGTPR